MGAMVGAAVGLNDVNTYTICDASIVKEVACFAATEGVSLKSLASWRDV